MRPSILVLSGLTLILAWNPAQAMSTRRKAEIMMRVDDAERALDNEEFRQTRAKRLALENAMKIPRDRRGLPERHPTEEELDQLRPKWPWSKDLRHEYMQTVLVYDHYVKLARDNYNEAIKLVVESHKGWPGSGLAVNEYPLYHGKYLIWPPKFLGPCVPGWLKPNVGKTRFGTLTPTFYFRISGMKPNTSWS